MSHKNQKPNISQLTGANKRNELLKLAIAFMIPFILVLGARFFLLDNFNIPSASMEPTLMTGDNILVFLPKAHTPTRGEVIVFKDTLGWLTTEYPGKEYLVKRVIGIGGDTISCCTAQGQVILNGNPLVEPYIEGTNNIRFKTLIVPKNKVFVMGDNRNDSADSRYHINTGTEFISDNSIIGKVWLNYWPLNKIHFIN